jgi:hypothetical protein
MIPTSVQYTIIIVTRDIQLILWWLIHEQISTPLPKWITLKLIFNSIIVHNNHQYSTYNAYNHMHDSNMWNQFNDSNLQKKVNNFFFCYCE